MALCESLLPAWVLLLLLLLADGVVARGADLSCNPASSRRRAEMEQADEWIKENSSKSNIQPTQESVQ